MKIKYISKPDQKLTLPNPEFPDEKVYMEDYFASGENDDSAVNMYFSIKEDKGVVEIICNSSLADIKEELDINNLDEYDILSRIESLTDEFTIDWEETIFIDDDENEIS